MMVIETLSRIWIWAVNSLLCFGLTGLSFSVIILHRLGICYSSCSQMVKRLDEQLLNSTCFISCWIFTLWGTQTTTVVEIILIVWRTVKEGFIDTIRLDRPSVGLESVSWRVLSCINIGISKLVCPRKSVCSKLNLKLWCNGNSAPTTSSVFLKEKVVVSLNFNTKKIDNWYCWKIPSAHAKSVCTQSYCGSPSSCCVKKTRIFSFLHKPFP